MAYWEKVKGRDHGTICPQDSKPMQPYEVSRCASQKLGSHDLLGHERQQHGIREDATRDHQNVTGVRAYEKASDEHQERQHQQQACTRKCNIEQDASRRYCVPHARNRAKRAEGIGGKEYGRRENCVMPLRNKSLEDTPKENYAQYTKGQGEDLVADDGR
mmetsp:Transcript_40975/g.162220  ORF Transcript_40975/g.162220 Transcript_40975/m.162220 type:complete len:160 (+) Transcript_40975:3523-4002(+)